MIKVPYRQRLQKRGRSDARRESGNNPEVTISDFKKEELWEEKQKKLNWSRLQDFWPWGLRYRDCWLLDLQSQKEGDVLPCLWLRVYWSKPTKQQFIKINLNLKGLHFPGISAFSICVYTNGSWVSLGLSKKLLYMETHTWAMLPRGISPSELFSQADLLFFLFFSCFPV